VNLLPAIGFLQTNSAGEPWTRGVENVAAKPGKYQPIKY
jgi:cytochrome b